MSAEIFDQLGLPVRETEIVRMLIRCVPLLTLSQIATNFYAGDRANAVRTLRRLTNRKLLVAHRLITRTPPTPMVTPLASWSPGLEAPTAYRLAFRLGQRWLCQGSRSRQCFTAGPAISALLGISPAIRPLRPLQASHDLGLAEQFLYFYRQQDSRCRWWIGELHYSDCANPDIAELLSDGTQRPDAFLLKLDEQVDYALEYGGIYNAKRIERFHRWCQRRSLPYEIW